MRFRELTGESIRVSLAVVGHNLAAYSRVRLSLHCQPVSAFGSYLGFLWCDLGCDRIKICRSESDVMIRGKQRFRQVKAQLLPGRLPRWTAFLCSCQHIFQEAPDLMIYFLTSRSPKCVGQFLRSVTRTILRTYRKCSLSVAVASGRR